MRRSLDKDLFAHVSSAAQLRQRGWRAEAQACTACGKRVWGPGAAGGIYSAWEKARAERQRQQGRQQEERRLESAGEVSAVRRGKSVDLGRPENGGPAGEAGEGVGGLVLFSCRHVFHRRCLQEEGEAGLRCGICAAAAARDE